MSTGEVNAVDHFEDQFLGEGHEPLGLPFDEEANFFPIQRKFSEGEEFAPAHPVEEFDLHGTIRSASTSAKWVPFRC